ncbi:MAG: hypothetical protein K0S47_2386 [Herbinix sp.]|jgi:hypothetical protein|nr:hypothetical protein [Herbinix sp.]
MLKKIIKYKRSYLLGLIPISFLLIFLAKQNSFIAEQIFALHIYKWISQIVSTITGILPFSLAEIIVVTLPAVILAVLVVFIIQLIKDKGKRRLRLLKGILNILCTISVLLFMFVLMAGINYYRYPFSYYSKLNIRDSSVEELYALTESLAIQAGELRAQVPETDQDGVYRLSFSDYELADKMHDAYRLLSKEYPILGGFYGSPKPVFFSNAMSHTEITGIFFPFTMEANVNVDIPDYSIASTMGHELAHLRGFMREDEANFIAYLVSMESDSVEIKYSGTMLALIISGNALYSQDPDLYFEIRDLYTDGLLLDIKANSSYWQQFNDTAISTVSNKINDTYLKANSQEDGVKSYGRMVDLLLAKYRKDNDLE